MQKVSTQRRREFLCWFLSSVGNQVILRCLVSDSYNGTSAVGIHLYSGVRPGSDYLYQIIYRSREPRIYQKGITTVRCLDSSVWARNVLEDEFDWWSSHSPTWLETRSVVALRQGTDNRVEEISPTGIMLLQHYSCFLSEVIYHTEQTSSALAKIHLKEIFPRLSAFLVRQNAEWARLTGHKW